MNLIMLFLILLGNVGLGVLNLFLLVHGLLSALFFFLIDQVQKIYGTRMLPALGGLSVLAPFLSGLM
jgi:formate hydrogenlyase subunit 3/multisubunit Na+/H+ antiporter MnhD subunit